MATPIHLPKVGMTMEEGTLTKWVAVDGASVKRGDVIFEMETEKVQMEIEADADGALKHLVSEGDVLHPGEVVGVLLAAGEAVPQALLDQVAAQGGTPPPAPSPLAERGSSPEVSSAAGASGAGVSPAPNSGDGAVRASPIARRLADENGIDVRTLTGSGPDGRIVERDVQRAIEAKTAAPAVSTPEVSSAAGGPGAGASPAPAMPGASSPYAGRRRTTGQRMHESLASMAQLTLVSETGVDEALTMLHGLNREWRKDGIVVTLTGLIVRASAIALREHPGLNARLDGDQIIVAPEVHVGVAVNQEHGLMVPVVRNADATSLKEVAQNLHMLVQKARADTLQLDDVSGGTFTVTSLEGTVVDAFTPIINPPQAAILGVGRVREVAAFEDANVVKRQVTTLSLTFDHRLNDGAPAAVFLERVGELLSRPYMLM